MVVSNIFGIFTPILGEDFQFDSYIFQMGGSTDQLQVVNFACWIDMD